MKKVLMKNSVLKVISLVLGILLWYYVIIIVDPPVTKTFENIPIRLLNKNFLKASDCVVKEGKEQFVDIEIRGNRKTIAEIDAKNISAFVDLSVDDAREGKAEYDIEVEIKSLAEQYEIVSQSKDTLTVEIDKIQKKQISISVDDVGTLSPEYTFDAPRLENEEWNTVTVSGPKSVVKNIDRAVALVNPNTVLEKDGQDLFTVSLTFYEEGDKVIDFENDVYYRGVEVEFDTVKVICPVWKTFKNVKIEVPLGELEEEYEVVKVVPETVDVKRSAGKDDDKEFSLKTEQIERGDISGNGIVKVELKPDADVKLIEDIETVEVILEKK